jgi:hypothetical protein
MTDPVLSFKTDNGRYYRNPGSNKINPSITNIKDIKNIKALKYYFINTCARYAADNSYKFSGLDNNEIYKLVKDAPWAPKPIEENPSGIGDIIHGYIDEDIKRTLAGGGPEVNTEIYFDRDGNENPTPRIVKDMWRQYRGFVKRYEPKWWASEFTVWSDTYGYAGTADWAAYIKSPTTGNYGGLTLGDNKSGKNVYADTALQLAALANADYIINEAGNQTELPKFERFGVLHIRPRFTRLIPFVNIDEAFKAFLGLKDCFDWQIGFEDTTMIQAPKTEIRVGQ